MPSHFSDLPVLEIDPVDLGGTTKDEKSKNASSPSHRPDAPASSRWSAARRLPSACRSC